MSDFKLPDVGEGLTEAEIVTWRVAVGDVVEVNDVLVDIETAKSIVELPSPFAGTVQRLMVEEGTTVAVGTPIIAIGEAVVEEAPAADEPAGDEPEPERQPVLVGYGPRTGAVTRRRRKAPTASTGPVQPRPLTVTALAKPPVRKRAKDLGVDLRDIAVDGHVVTRADVEAFAAGGAPRATSSDETRVPVKGVRKATAEAMVASAFTAPHVTEWITLDVSRTVELVERMKADPAFADVKVSPLLLVARAVCLAMRRTPAMNARWDGGVDGRVDGGVDGGGPAIVHRAGVNLGIAAATERGLVVPVIDRADALSTHELAVALADLVVTAREGRTQPAQLAGGTFTITNVGVFGVDAGTPILNPGQTGILAVGAIDRRPWVAADDTIVPRWVTTLALSFDHRVVDGAEGSRFLADVAALLRDPSLALAY